MRRNTTINLNVLEGLPKMHEHYRK